MFPRVKTGELTIHVTNAPVWRDLISFLSFLGEGWQLRSNLQEMPSRLVTRVALWTSQSWEELESLDLFPHSGAHRWLMLRFILVAAEYKAKIRTQWLSRLSPRFCSKLENGCYQWFYECSKTSVSAESESSAIISRSTVFYPCNANSRRLSSTKETEK